MYRRRRKMRSSYRRRGITRRIRRKSRIKSARRGLFLRPRTGAYPEVKYFDNYLGNKAITCENRTTGTHLGVNVMFGQILDALPLGTGRNNRIGVKIHVKKIQLKIYAATCGITVGSVAKFINSALLRVMCSNLEPGSPGSTYTDVANYWGVTAYTDKMICPINRRNFDVYFDKVYNITQGYPNFGDATGPDNYAGAHKFIKISIPINRTIEFTDENKVKECQDNYTISAYSAFPGFLNATTTQYTPVCLNAGIRVYYTDN